MKLVAVAPVAGVLFLAGSAFLGWWSPERPWPVATGWSSIPHGRRADVQDPFDGTPLSATGSPDLTWLGHAGFLLEWHGCRLLFDPNLSDRCTIARRTLERPMRAGDLPAVDAVLVSHAHMDHLDLPTLRGLPGFAALIVPRGSEAYVEALAGAAGAGIAALRPDEEWTIGPLTITAVAADHHGNRWHPLASGQLAIGYVVRGPAGALYYAGDTGAGIDFAALGRRFEPSVAILPIGAYAPAFPVGRVHLSPEEAVVAAGSLGVDRVVPSHFGTFRLSWDRPADALPRFARAAAEAKLDWVMPRLAGSRSGEVER